MGPQGTTAAGFITVADAASQLGVTPWEVMRLIKAGELQSLVLIETASLEAMKEKS